MDFEKLWQYAQQAVIALGNGWEIKLGIAGLLTAARFHAELLFFFVLLVCIDLVTKWIALSKPFCDCNPPSIWHEFLAIPEARRQGVISSEKMKTRFAGKILVYLLVAIASGVVDLILKDLGHGPVFMALCIGYLAATELLSIIENLNDAGVAAVSDLLTVIKKVRGK